MRGLGLIAFLVIGLLAHGSDAGVYVVTTTTDHDAGVCDATDCTLREAITAGNAQDDSTITFGPGVTGFIDLNSPLPILSRNLTIIGPGADVLTVRRVLGGNYRILTISNGTSAGPVVNLRGLTLNNGIAAYRTDDSSAAGGCVYNDRGTLRILKCAMTGNHATVVNT